MAHGQTAFQLANVTGTIDGKDFSLVEGNNLIITGSSKVGDFIGIGMGMYEYDTGLNLAGDLKVEPMPTALGIKLLGGFNSISTNVDMGPARTVIDWSYWLSLTAVIGAIVIIAVLMIKRCWRRK